MLVIRFIRTGKKNQPFFRIVVTDKKNPPKGGRFLEILGNFNPRTKEKQLKPERIKYWISVGAKPSPRAHNLFVTEGIIKAKKIPVHKKPEKKDQPAGSTPVQAPVSTQAPVSASATPAQPEPGKEAPVEQPKPE